MEKEKVIIKERPVAVKEYIKVTNFDTGEMIFNKGDSGDCMYEVLSGRVGIFLHYRTPEQQLLTVKEPGQFFGEIALIEVVPRTAAAVALDDMTQLRIVGVKGIIPYLKQKPEVLQSILDTMSARIKQGRDLYIETCGVIAKYKSVVDSGETPDQELSGKIDNCLEAFDRYQKKLNSGA